MSTTIDSKVVEMRFDNKHFEKHTRETISTLDKLKQKLNLTGASKGLENINTSANKVNFNGMAGALDTVRSKFSALEVMGVTALANITNSAVNAGKRMIAALTIDPIKTGFNEYETQLNAVQTIMANVGHKGKTLDDVNNALEELNKYADQTIYNFTEMTRNIGLFTNAGVDLDTSVAAIKGFSNAAAMAGTNATDTSRAMYQLSQAMSSGTVKLLDWKSLETANITGERFQETIKETAKVHGINVDAMIQKEGSFRETLKDGWLTADLMSEALNHYTLSRDTMTEAEQKAAKAQMLNIGYTEEQIEKLFDLGTEASNAATKVKSFTQLFDVLKESAQSGWAKTWQIIIGDFEEAKALFSPLAEFLTGIIDKISTFRNTILEKALSHNPFTLLLDKLNNSGIGKVADKINNISKSLEYYQDMVNKVWRGDYKNQPVRSGLLEAEGHSYKVIQSLVNKGYQYKLTVEDVAEAEKKYGITVKETTEAITELSDVQLKEMGLTDSEIKMYRQLEEQSKKTGKSISELIEEMSNTDGRTLLIESFKNIGMAITDTLKNIKKAWNDVFHPGQTDDEILEEKALKLYGIISAFRELTAAIPKLRDENGNLTETGDKLVRTFKGIFAILDMVTTLVAGPIKIAGKILIQFLQALDILPVDILGMTATIGDAIVKFRDWLDSVLDFTGVFKALAPYIKDGAVAVRGWFKNLGQSEAIKKFTEFLIKSKDAVADWFKGLRETEDIGKYIFEGLFKGLSNGAKGVIDFVINLGKQILTGIREVLGIHSPSKEFYEIGQNIIQGLFNGISDLVKMVYELITSMGGKLIEIVKSLDLGSIFTIALGSGFVFGLIKIGKAIDALSSPFEGLGDVLYEAKETLQVFQGTLKSFSLNLKAEAIKSIAIAIGILAASVAVLALLDQTKVWSAVGAITALVILLGGLTAIVGKFGPKESIDFGKIALTLVGLGIALAIMSKAVKTIGTMETGNLIQAGIAITILSGIIVGLMAATKLISGSKNVDKIGSTLLKIAGAMLVMVVVAKIAGSMKPEELIQGALAIVAFSALIVGLMTATKLISGSKNVGKIGGAILGIAAALLIMSIVTKILSGMEIGELAKGIIATALLGGIVVGLVAATKLVSGKDLTKVGTTLFMMSISIGLLAVVTALLGLMDMAHLAKGIIAVGLLSVMVMGLVAATRGAQNVLGTMVAITVAIGILAIAVGALSLIEPKKLAGATVALGILLGMFALIIASTKFAQSAMGTLIVLTVAIAILAGALYLIAQLPVENALGSSIALSLLMGAMAIILKILGSMGTATGKALIGVVGMLGLVVVLLALTGVLAIMQNIQNASKNATVLAVFLGVLAVVQLLCAAAGAIYAATGGMAMLGIVGMLGLVVVLYVLMGALAIMSCIPNAITNLEALTKFLIIMTGVLVVLAIVGPLALIGVAAMAGLTILMVAIAGLAVTMGYLMEKSPALQSFLDKGLPILIQIANGIGKMVGAFIEGALTQITNTLPGIGQSLSAFMIGVTPFIIGCKMVDKSVLSGVGILTGAIIALTAADFIQNVSSFLTGGSSFATLGTELSQFMINAMPFLMLSKMIDPNIMTGVKSLAEAILILTATDILDSVTSWLTGGNSLGNFSSQLETLGVGIRGFITAIGPVTEEQVNIARNAAEIIKTLASAAKEIPNTGGLLGDLVGENDMSNWAVQLPLMAAGIAGFVKIIANSGIESKAIETANTAAQVIQTLANAAKEIPNTGGRLAELIGDNDMGTFASELPNVGAGIAGFVKAMSEGEITSDKAEVANTAAQIIQTLANAAQTVPNAGGKLAEWFGDNDFSTFAGELPEVGKGIAGFANELGEFGSDKLNTVNVACRALEVIAKMADIGIKDIGKDSKSFGENLVKLAEKIKDFVSKISDIGGDNITSAIYKVKELAVFAAQLSEFKLDSLNSFSENLKKVATEGVKGFVSELSGESPKTDASNAMKALVDSGIQGAEDKKTDVKNKFGEIAKDAVSAINTDDNKSSATQAGKDLVQGLINGLTNQEKLNEVYNAAFALGQKAVEGEMAGQQSHSPSKATERAGKWLGEGLVIGIQEMGSKVYNAGKSMGEEATNSISGALNTALNLLNSDMDTCPTIRPVLDLSEVESGVGALGSMFNDGPSIGVMSNLKAISSGMNARNQNGINNDVVSAINKLGKNLGNTKSGDTYNINGMTYDDGSNITEAVKQLYRAVKMERRT